MVQIKETIAILHLVTHKNIQNIVHVYKKYIVHVYASCQMPWYKKYLILDNKLLVYYVFTTIYYNVQ